MWAVANKSHGRKAIQHLYIFNTHTKAYCRLLSILIDDLTPQCPFANSAHSLLASIYPPYTLPRHQLPVFHPYEATALNAFHMFCTLRNLRGVCMMVIRRPLSSRGEVGSWGGGVGGWLQQEEGSGVAEKLSSFLPSPHKEHLCIISPFTW